MIKKLPTVIIKHFIIIAGLFKIVFDFVLKNWLKLTILFLLICFCLVIINKVDNRVVVSEDFWGQFEEEKPINEIYNAEIEPVEEETIKRNTVKPYINSYRIYENTPIVRYEYNELPTVKINRNYPQRDYDLYAPKDDGIHFHMPMIDRKTFIREDGQVNILY